MLEGVVDRDSVVPEQVEQGSVGRFVGGLDVEHLGALGEAVASPCRYPDPPLPVGVVNQDYVPAPVDGSPVVLLHPFRLRLSRPGQSPVKGPD